MSFQVWNLTNCKLKTNHFGHTGYLNCVTVSPDGSLCASGGKVSITVKQQYLTAIIFGGFSNMVIWQIINLALSNTGISRD